MMMLHHTGIEERLNPSPVGGPHATVPVHGRIRALVHHPFHHPTVRGPVLHEAVLELVMWQGAGVGMAAEVPKSAAWQRRGEPQATGVIQVQPVQLASQDDVGVVQARAACGILLAFSPVHEV